MNKKIINKKGFTLIELLAVISILAIIAVIAIPNIVTLVDNSKKQEINAHKADYERQKKKLEDDRIAYIEEQIEEFGFAGSGSHIDLADNLGQLAKNKAYELINKYM